MVLGLRSKNKKGNSVQIDYYIHVQEIKPWPPSQNLKSTQSIVFQWENGDRNYGSFISSFEDGKFVSESFRLPVTLCWENSKKVKSFHRNYLEFNLYEPKKDRATKGQPLGSAVINLADFGIIEDNAIISAPISLKKNYKGNVQPVLYINIRPLDSEKSTLSKGVSLEKDGSESVSEVTNEDSEIASFTDDDSSYVVESSKSSPGQEYQNGQRSTPYSRLAPPNTEESTKSNHAGSVETFPNKDANGKAWLHDSSEAELAVTSTSHTNLSGVERRKQQSNGQDRDISAGDQLDSQEKLIDKLPHDAMPKQVQLRSNTLAMNRTATAIQANTRRDKLKHLKSVQLQFDSTESIKPISDPLFLENAKKINFADNARKTVRSNSSSERESLDYKINSKPAVEIRDKSVGEAADANSGLNSVDAEKSYSVNKVQIMKKVKENDLTQNIRAGGTINVPSGKEEPKNRLSGNNVELESKVEILEEELMEAAALEVGLYSVVAEHGSSTSKVHAPARRLSRFYFHACKARSQAKRASAARAIISGLVLVSKACGNDVPRLTFWLSNSIVIRAIVSQTAESRDRKAWHESSTYEDPKTNGKESCDEWEKSQTYIMALEKFEAWIFSRIVESIWWQTLTPHMQSTALKGSNSKKHHSRRNGLGDQEQGNFAIDLWKRAFKDACERLCPIRAGGHECGCLPVLARLVMEQLVGRLDVAMLNAILRESAEDMPTDPVSDPICDPKVLPVPAGKFSFGAGAQLKNAVGNWSRWLTDLFGIEDDDSLEHQDETNGNRLECEASFKAFNLLKALSDLMMLPFEMLADRSTRKEVCPTFGTPLIKRLLNNFVPDEFNPNPLPTAILEALDSEDLVEETGESIKIFPINAAPTIYCPPPACSLQNIIGDFRSQMLKRSASTLLQKSYTSDDELEELDSPMNSIIMDNSRTSPASSTTSSWMDKGKWSGKVVRYHLLQEAWKDSE
ncbi:hypothetical protein K2173_002653 [Erythroxylum novogranatense]|uniref:C2 NT-type domain-containing protein n=1 Tax=Erythroxylum novogranatense TaxID=1862640 RepID=A0AAV8SXV3_9ROSI|nr:hypothetical protein K2173_002653 [Erythroxylum novogranatense]